MVKLLLLQIYKIKTRVICPPKKTGPIFHSPSIECDDVTWIDSALKRFPPAILLIISFILSISPGLFAFREALPRHEGTYLLLMINVLLGWAWILVVSRSFCVMFDKLSIKILTGGYWIMQFFSVREKVFSMIYLSQDDGVGLLMNTGKLNH